MGKTLIIIGLMIALVGVLWPMITKLGLGRLPGDIRIQREGFSFYFPLTTILLVSLVVTAILRLLGR